ncbi:MAG: FAD:protein FMN transferase [Lachnospiraceae bacterium]|nr:FAD:protein FMN transferase [Lachnospiraceae bacterium]
MLKTVYTYMTKYVKNCKKNKSVLKTLVILSLFIASVCLCSCKSRNTCVSKTGLYFDTVVTISIYDRIPGADSDRIIESCFNMMSEYEKTFSRTYEGSDIYRINHAGGTPVSVSDMTIDLLDQSIYYAGLSDGAVDPTVGALSILWNIGSDNDNSVPDDESVKRALSATGYKNIEITGNKVALRAPGMALDLGFIAKGYVADRLKEYLLSEGITSAIIDLGGNILLIGNKSGDDFNIGLKDPLDPQGTPITTIRVSDCSIVSSGDYERFFEKDGIRYHHILSLQTGYPAVSDLSMVTVISDKSTDGDALSTLCFVLGKDASSKFLKENFPDVNAVFVDKKGNVSYLK